MRDKWDAIGNKGQHGPLTEVWTPFLQHEFDYNPLSYETTGEFWITMQELTEFFGSVDVCRVASWDSLSIKGQFIRRQKKQTDHAEEAAETSSKQVSFASKWFYGLEVASKSLCIIGLH